MRAGENVRVEIELRSLFKRLERESKPRNVAFTNASTNVYGDPNYNPKEDPTYEDPKATKGAVDLQPTHGSIFAGPVVVFGVASWMPAVGAAVGGAWRPNEYFSLGLEGRAAWLTVGVADAPISAMTAGDCSPRAAMSGGFSGALSGIWESCGSSHNPAHVHRQTSDVWKGRRRWTRWRADPFVASAQFGRNDRRVGT